MSGSAAGPPNPADFVEGLYVKIKNCSEEEALRIFGPTSVSFNAGSMRRFLGSGGVIREKDADSCKISTPAETDYWWWPLKMLEPLRCSSDHTLRLANRPSPGCCDGCDCKLSVTETVHRCDACDLDLCAQCAKKQATWSVGHTVKIGGAGTSAAEAERIQRSGPAGWVDGMSEHLGEIRTIEQFRVGRCQLSGGFWWMLGLLEDPDTGGPNQSARFGEGLYVKIKGCNYDEAQRLFRDANETINSEMRKLLGSGGAVRWSRETKCALFTPDKSDWWNWPHSMLEPLQCRQNHELKLVSNQLSEHHCDGCRSALDGRKVHRCSECDFDLCEECAEKQATWSVGRSVKIRRGLSAAEVERVQRAGPGWSSSMLEDLGESKQIQRFSGGRCKLSNGVWWMLGLLESSTDAEPDAESTEPEPATAGTSTLVEGRFVRIKSCNVDQARRIFSEAGVHFNSSMEGFLGTGGEVKSRRENKCDVYTPDKSDYWTWPFQMLEELQCSEDHKLQVQRVPQNRRCDGCRDRIAVGSNCYRCEACDFDLCDTCAEKQATWSKGQLVKIRNVGVEEAQQMQDSGPAGWVASMATQLGAIKEIQDFRPGRCQLSGNLWWMLGLLEPAGHALQIGSMVRIRDGVQPSRGWGRARGETGQVIEIEDDGDVTVRFPSQSRWRGRLSELQLLDAAVSSARAARSDQREGQGPIRVGSLVRVRRGISTPRFSWGAVEPGEQGRVVLLEDGGNVRIDFPSQSDWHGVMSELELCDDEDGVFDAARGDATGAGADSDAEAESTEETEFGGHDEDWADEEAAAALHCPICLKVCRDAVMHSCRTIFCESCWNQCHASDSKCPVCRNSERPAAPAYQQQWDIGKLLIKCPNGCGEAISLTEKQELLPKHLAECPCRKETCPHCASAILAAEFAEHLETCDAKVECDLCGAMVAASAMEEHRSSPSKEHMAALIKENCALKRQVQGLQKEVGNLKEAFTALGFATD